MKLLLATKNRDKVAEIRHALSGLHLELISAADRDDLPEIEEDAETLTGNAIKKAQTLFRLTGIPSLADDTGLEVDALDGAPGVYSSRYSGTNASYADNVEKLLRELAEVPDTLRSARFRTVIALADSDGTATVEGVCEGKIIAAARGEAGFGYDPVFYYPPAQKTFAEMTAEQKNAISHRGIALRKAAELLRAKYRV